ncbi:MAG: response regulator transcription factor [Bifidobacteriaceae bacterium]|jgi:DNA-binding response OmpR family regulator|nr:response regulator transcription factor [Bifidobacteriaceae bacterium]
MAGQDPGQLRAVVVDDEPALASLVASYLRQDGFAVWQAGTGPDGLAAVREHDPAVVVLDLSLPGLDGVEVARQLRTFTDAYVIMLTARAEEVDKLIGLAVGADDYMTKPFSPRELAARVRALLRRPRSLGGAPVQPVAAPAPRGATLGTAAGPGGSAAPARPQVQAPPEPPLSVGDLVVDPVAREASLAGRPIELTRTEFDLLATLAATPGKAFTRVELLRAVWGPTWVGDPHAADVHLAHVRRKLGDTASDQRFIRTVRGVGYRLGTGR